jgi:hypothetical protein
MERLLWRAWDDFSYFTDSTGETETGMINEIEDECLFPDSVRMDLEMELLQEITNLAWEEAKDR